MDGLRTPAKRAADHAINQDLDELQTKRLVALQQQRLRRKPRVRADLEILSPIMDSEQPSPQVEGQKLEMKTMEVTKTSAELTTKTGAMEILPEKERQTRRQRKTRKT